MSLVPERGPARHFATGARVARELVERLLAAPLHHSMILNVNAPDLPYDEIRGFQATRLGYRHRTEAVVKSTDPRGRPIYWVGAAGPGQDALLADVAGVWRRPLGRAGATAGLASVPDR